MVFTDRKWKWVTLLGNDFLVLRWYGRTFESNLSCVQISVFNLGFIHTHLPAASGTPTLASQIQHAGVVIGAIVRHKQGFGGAEDFNVVV